MIDVKRGELGRLLPRTYAWGPETTNVVLRYAEFVSEFTELVLVIDTGFWTNMNGYTHPSVTFLFNDRVYKTFLSNMSKA